MMGRCNHVIHYVTSFCLVFISFDLVSSQSCYNDARDEAIALFYGGGLSSPYTCDDMQGIKHGSGCRKKCNAVTNAVMNSGCNPTLTFPQCFKRSSSKRPDIDLECGTLTASCTSGYEYRHIDGSCNNLRNPLWGKSDRVQNRLLPDVYENGRDSPRTTGCVGKLPSARKVSNIIHRADAEVKFDPQLSYMMMQVGQFLAHDVVLTELFERSDGEPLQCCEEDSDDRECFPIDVPEDDTHFEPGGCMNFARSKARQDCNGIRQQVNAQTSYIDLSMVYGANEKEARILRSLDKGLLKTVLNKLPVDVIDETCELSRAQHIPNYYCTLAGDLRADEQPGLSSIHTLFVREHNRLATRLFRLNPHWDDERLYQVARKINIAQWQNIVYTEYLPLVLGPYIMRKYNLNIRPYGYKDTYSARADATIFNSFAASGLRFGHSLIHRNISLLDFDMKEITSPFPLENHFFEPDLYHRISNNNYGLENILLWTSTTQCPQSDRKLEASVQDNLYLDSENDSLDLAALNIQRARDHGLPSYNAFRKQCRLSEVTHFGTGRGGLVNHDQHVADLFRQVYTCPEDIDLFPGFLSERTSAGSILGPTGQCLLATQFKKLRDGDRFFFERRDFRTPWIGFTPAQLLQIKRIKMSTILCLNTSLERLHRNIFYSPDTGSSFRFSRNSPMPCRNRRGVNLYHWRDRFTFR